MKVQQGESIFNSIKRKIFRGLTDLTKVRQSVIKTKLHVYDFNYKTKHKGWINSKVTLSEDTETKKVQEFLLKQETIDDHFSGNHNLAINLVEKINDEKFDEFAIEGDNFYIVRAKFSSPVLEKFYDFEDSIIAKNIGHFVIFFRHNNNEIVSMVFTTTETEGKTVKVSESPIIGNDDIQYLRIDRVFRNLERYLKFSKSEEVIKKTETFAELHRDTINNILKEQGITAPVVDFSNLFQKDTEILKQIKEKKIYSSELAAINILGDKKDTGFGKKSLQILKNNGFFQDN